MEDLHQRIAAVLAANGTTTLLIAGDLPDALRAQLPTRIEVRSAEAPSIDGAEPSGLVAGGAPDRAVVTALVIIDDPDDDSAFDQRLGTACRRFPGRLLVWSRSPVDSRTMPATRFFAHGFRLVIEDADDVHRETLYEFRLADYKQQPDWLNSRFWANPERFNDIEP